VAVKLLREDLVGNPDAAERFRQEARTAAAFAHPNVVTVHDFGVTSGRAYLVMELLNGTTLREAIRQRARFAAAEAMPILRGVAAAVAAAHERKIVHRDLKPENIFLVRNGNTEVTKVLDFGIAKFVGVNQTQGLTGAGTDIGLLLGTLPYMAPEQLRGEEVTPGWDLWALAIITCEMLTGRHPFALMFTGASTAASQMPLPESLSELSPRCQAFFARALAAEPERRPSSAALFLAELEQALPTE
jgi:serine/threonine protein kinase